MSILLGCDPEFFITNRRGTIVPAYLSGITGTKECPQKLSVGAVQVDGMALEFNINPASTLEEWKYNIKTTIKEIEDMIEDKGFSISTEVSNTFSQITFNKTPEIYRELGCSPDFFASIGSYEVRSVPDYIKFSKKRSCGGHIHIGWTQNEDVNDLSHIQDCQLISTLLSKILLVPTIEGMTWRRDHYGAENVIRVKPYGMEFRSPDNSWIFYETSMERVYNVINKLFEYLNRYPKIDITNTDSEFEDVIDEIYNYVHS